MWSAAARQAAAAARRGGASASPQYEGNATDSPAKVANMREQVAAADQARADSYHASQAAGNQAKADQYRDIGATNLANAHQKLANAHRGQS